MIKNIKNLLLILLLIILGIISINKLKSDYEVVARINNNRIYKKDILGLINSKYLEVGTNEYIENLLLSEKIKEVKKPKLEDIKKSYINYEKVYGKAGYRENVEKFYYITELMKKYSVREKSLKEYAEELVEENGNKVIVVKKVVASEDMISDIMKSLEKGSSIESIEKNYDINFKKEELFSENKYKLDINNCSNLDRIRMDSIDDDIQDIHAACKQNYSENEMDTLLVVDSISDNNVERVLEDKDNLMENYIIKNYQSEYENLLNKLKKLNGVEIEIKPE